MKKSEIQLLLIVIGIVSAILSWQLVYKNYVEKTEVVEEQNIPIKERLDNLEILNAKQGEYIAETERMREESTAIINTFPSGYLNEDIIMYLYNMELIDDNEVAISTISMQEGNQIPYSGILNVDSYTLEDEGIQMFTNRNTMTFTTTYNGLKNVLNYVYGISTRKSVSAVNVSATDEGYLAGTMDINFYCLIGSGVPYVETNILGVPTGTSNFFGVRNGTLADIVPGEEGENAEGENAEGGEGAENAEGGNAEAGN
ncbi:MAG: hypothetical protein HDR03_00560 [Lachnospiraceae bacterium]|nr:hypothetical protein [Lachnospiraceae bacterium]